MKSKHRVVVVPQLNINSTAIVKVPTSMNHLYVKCWIESNVVRKLTQHSLPVEIAKYVFQWWCRCFCFSFAAVLVLPEENCSLKQNYYYWQKKLIEKFEKKCLQKDLWRTFVVFGKKQWKVQQLTKKMEISTTRPTKETIKSKRIFRLLDNSIIVE